MYFFLRLRGEDICNDGNCINECGSVAKFFIAIDDINDMKVNLVYVYPYLTLIHG